MHRSTRSTRRLIVMVSCGLAAGYLFGCEEKKPPSRYDVEHPIPSREENIRAADELNRLAVAAEQRGDDSRALEIYNQLRSFPDYARPKDLDQRIRDVRSHAAPVPWAASRPST